MFEHLLKQYQNLVPVLGFLAVLLMLTLGVVTAVGRKKTATKEDGLDQNINPQAFSQPLTNEAEAEALPETIIITKVASESKPITVSYSIEEILTEPTEEELAIAEAIAEAGMAASNSETQQAQISFADEDKTSWRQAIKESLQRRMQRASDREQISGGHADKMGIIVLYVMAPRSTQFQGPSLMSVLKAQGLSLTDKRVFQMKDLNGTSFYVASAVNPGTFDLDFIHSFMTPGLSFILDLSAVKAPKQAFTKMLEIVSNVAEQLGGDVLDEHRQRLTQAGINEYMAQIKSVEMLRKRNDYA